jgi:hypothetical protein
MWLDASDLKIRLGNVVWKAHKKSLGKIYQGSLATLTGLEPATSGSTVRDSNQLSYSA